MSYEPWKGELEDGTEVLVSLELSSDTFLVQAVDSVEVAFRSHRQHTWGPPVTLERAP